MGAVALLVAVGVCALFIRYDIRIATASELQRDDWRGLARALGRPTTDRAVIVAPWWQVKPLLLYERLENMPSPRRVHEVDVVVYHRPGWGRDAPPQPPPGPPFHVVQRLVLQRMALTRYRAARPSLVAPARLLTSGENRSGIFFERAP